MYHNGVQIPMPGASGSKEETRNMFCMLKALARNGKIEWDDSGDDKRNGRRSDRGSPKNGVKCKACD